MFIERHRFQGVSALHIAVNERNTAMVEYLLSHPDIDPGDTHLHAIRDNQVRVAVLILNKLNELTPGLEYAGVTHSPDFPDDTTPLAVAAQYGHFEMIDVLRFRRHILQKPHPSSCNCDEFCKYMHSSFYTGPFSDDIRKFSLRILFSSTSRDDLEIMQLNNYLCFLLFLFSLRQTGKRQR